MPHCLGVQSRIYRGAEHDECNGRVGLEKNWIRGIDEYLRGLVTEWVRKYMDVRMDYQNSVK